MLFVIHVFIWCVAYMGTNLFSLGVCMLLFFLHIQSNEIKCARQFHRHFNNKLSLIQCPIIAHSVMNMYVKMSVYKLYRVSLFERIFQGRFMEGLLYTNISQSICRRHPFRGSPIQRKGKNRSTAHTGSEDA